jgi:hypothetical protein
LTDQQYKDYLNAAQNRSYGIESRTMNLIILFHQSPLIAIAEKYAVRPGSTFGVTFASAPVDLKAFPVTVFS